jgi:hypothetical protein
MALAAVLNKAVSIRLAYQAFGVSQACYRYQAKLCSDNGLIADWLCNPPIKIYCIFFTILVQKKILM